MSADVVDLAARREQEVGYWTCNCGCTTHRVRSDGEIECGACGEVAESIGYWRKPLPDEAPREFSEGDAEPFTTVNVAPELSRRRHAKRVIDGEFVIALGIRLDGGLSTCREHGVITTDEQRAWLRRQLDHAYELIATIDGG